MYRVGFHHIEIFIKLGFDPDIDHFEPIVGEDDVHEVFTHVVNIPFDGSDDECCIGIFFLFGEIRVEIIDGSFHCLSTLQYKWQLHLPASKQLSDYFHRIDEDFVDDTVRVDSMAGIFYQGDHPLFVTIQQ